MAPPIRKRTPEQRERSRAAALRQRQSLINPAIELRPASITASVSSVELWAQNHASFEAWLARNRRLLAAEMGEAS